MLKLQEELCSADWQVFWLESAHKVILFSGDEPIAFVNLDDSESNLTGATRAAELLVSGHGTYI